MKYLKISILFFLLIGVFACEEELSEIEALVAPSNLVLTTNISQDGSGLVTFNASADGAMVFHFFPGVSENEKAIQSASGDLEYAYRSSGIYIARVVAYGPGGTPTNTSAEVVVEVTYEPPTDLINTLTSGSSRNWLWEKSVAGHLGVGPLVGDDGNPLGDPIWYQAQPFEKEADGCLYTDVMTFTLNNDNTISYLLDNKTSTYFNRGEVVSALGEAAPQWDACFDYDPGGVKNVGFFESASGLPITTNISFTIGSNGFLSYFLGNSTYEILSYTADEFVVRCIQTEDGGAQLAWYHRFIAEDAEEKEPETAYELVWSEEFEVDGAPDPANWSYDQGRGNNGWGNGEQQFYTDRADNSFVDNGTLKIVAKRENFNDTQFTSARIKTQDKFEFTYGKIEIRAKLPTGGGTWPALWLLGADFETNGWPACGEMDIMEHVGNNQDVVQAAVHTPSSFGDTQNKGDIRVDGVSNEFHVYELEWTAEGLNFGVDGNVYYTYNPDTKNDDTFPFNKDFFIILNVAMGGSLGGDIAFAFSESTMEVDYVRVYQNK